MGRASLLMAVPLSLVLLFHPLPAWALMAVGYGMWLTSLQWL